LSKARSLRCTYRLQLSADFDFAAARAVVPYLAALGVSHLYLSPIWAARPGSPQKLNERNIWFYG